MFDVASFPAILSGIGRHFDELIIRWQGGLFYRKYYSTLSVCERLYLKNKKEVQRGIQESGLDKAQFRKTPIPPAPFLYFYFVCVIRFITNRGRFHCIF